MSLFSTNVATDNLHSGGRGSSSTSKSSEHVDAPHEEPKQLAAAQGVSGKAQEVDALAHGVIAKRAYEKFVARGCVHGHDCADWESARQELRAASEPREDSASAERKQKAVSMMSSRGNPHP